MQPNSKQNGHSIRPRRTIGQTLAQEGGVLVFGNEVVEGQLQITLASESRGAKAMSFGEKVSGSGT